MKRVKVKIHGKVQGVFYRANTRDTADELEINGWVKNMPDGTVEAVFEGENEKVDEMIEWCKKGSPASDVKKVDVQSEEKIENKKFTGFEVRR
ncbi:MAG: acylphosphatase [Candidatus Undinarchaeales archaeon]